MTDINRGWISKMDA